MGTQMEKSEVTDFPLSKNNEIDLRDLFLAVWLDRVRILIVTLLFIAAAVIYSLSLQDQYKATILLAPAQSEANALTSSAGQLGGLASLAGLGIGSGKSSEAQIAIKIMQSWSFIENFIEKNEIAVALFAAEGYNDDSNALLINPDLYDTTSERWMFDDKDGNPGSPSSWELYQMFSDRLLVSQDRNTGLVTVEIEFYSAKLATEWLVEYVESINAYMQHRQIDKVTKNIAYLETQIAKTSISEMEEVFYMIIEDQIKSKMLAEASPEYVFVIVSPSMVPEVKSQPQRALIVVLGGIMGGMLSVLFSLVMHYAKKSN
jgi:LPS O-antigen subunit length determinant protein (WzzB/FepE family)